MIGYHRGRSLGVKVCCGNFLLESQPGAIIRTSSVPGQEGDPESGGPESVSNSVVLTGGRTAKHQRQQKIKNNRRENIYYLKRNKS